MSSPDRLIARWRGVSLPVRAVGGLVAGLLALRLVLAAIAYATGGAGPVGPPLSSYATTPAGLAAYAELLGADGRPVIRLREPLDAAELDPSATVVLLGPGRVARAETAALRDFLAAGGRLIAGGPRPAWLRRVLPGAPPWRPAGSPEASVLAPVEEVAGVRRVLTQGRGSWAPAGPALPLLGGEATVASVATAGPGRAVLLADASMLANRRLGDADNAAFGLAAAGEGRPVVFAEEPHGYGAATGVRAIPPRWRVALGGLAAATLVWLWASGRRLGPPEERGRTLAPPRHAFADAQGINLARAGSPEEAIAPLKTAARERLARRAGLGPAASEEALRSAAARLGLAADEAAALLAPVTSDHQLLAAGRAAAKLARHPVGAARHPEAM